MTGLWHFTCDHGHAGIGKRGILLPNRHLMMPQLGPVIWLTSDPAPSVDDVGLTATIITCDRMAYRYRMTGVANVYRWGAVADRIDPGIRADLESFGAPDTWWLASEPIEAVLT